MSFANIPEVVIDYVRTVFARANDRVSRKMGNHPSMHEETLDHALIEELTDAPPAFFAQERAAVVIESHWLGGRRMYGRWEIADIAVIILLRRQGQLLQRKVALLQTKRLYSHEIPVETLEPEEFRIGIGRLGDRTDRAVPLTTQRTFSFDGGSKYGAMHASGAQVVRIEDYVRLRGIPVYYAFYNPEQLPYQASYPALGGVRDTLANALGCRVQTMDQVHRCMGALDAGTAPSFDRLKAAGGPAASDQFAASGWRLEHFIADEVLKCRQGVLFDGSADENLEYLFYRRSAPIQAVIAVTIDVQGDS